jgi:hypothetical protein
MFLIAPCYLLQQELVLQSHSSLPQVPVMLLQPRYLQALRP